jgi:hypothetical protein
MLTALVIGGCRRTDTATSRPSPATNPAAGATPAASTVTIGDKSYQFPPARIVVEPADAGVLAQVFSDGASPEGERDGFFIEAPLDVPEAAQIDGASWQFESQSDQRAEDALTTITVNGGGNQLQPRDVTVTFRGVSPGVVEVRVNGSFNVFKGRDGTTSVGVVPVEATLLATRRGS